MIHGSFYSLILILTRLLAASGFDLRPAAAVDELAPGQRTGRDCCDPDSGPAARVRRIAPSPLGLAGPALEFRRRWVARWLPVPAAAHC